MTIEEARDLLPQYADGLLESQPTRELESLLAETPALQQELKQIKDDNALLEEAFAPLRSTRSRRMRLAETMAAMHRQATNVAETMPEYGWRLFKLSYSFLALLIATLAVYFHPPAGTVFLLATISVFFIGLMFLLCGGPLARTEAQFKNAFAKHKTMPSALEVLLIEVFGAAMILGAFGMYWWSM